MSRLKTRLAPSPTGHLHLGHGLHVLSVQGLAAHFEADITLRLEDHDQSRCRPEFESSILRDLNWLGVKTPSNPWHQSSRGLVYTAHLENLVSRGLVYACACSRKNIQQQTGQASGELTYPGTCRDLGLDLDQPGTSLRLRISPAHQPFRDIFLGEQGPSPHDASGDVVIRDRTGQWTYSFAVVIDDLEQEINLVIRGTDLLASTSRQLAMRQLISPNSQTPLFAHHPLLLDDHGQKLSKRFFSETLSKLRDEGLSPDAVRGLAAHLGGLQPSAEPLSLTQLPKLFKNVR
jgi:glutamyl/glutaminyl-tRNA synthetase